MLGSPLLLRSPCVLEWNACKPCIYYSVSVDIGRPPKAYDLDIDTGSDLTWVQCDIPCNGCTKCCDLLHKPNNNLVHCDDPLCTSIRTPRSQPYKTDTDQCVYEVEYAVQGSSLGVLVNDYFPLRLTNGSNLISSLALGCGYNQHYTGSISPPSTAGVLGLATGKASIISQHYLFGLADIIYSGKPTGVKGLQVLFDSESSYTYLNSKTYQAVLGQVRADMTGKPLNEDNSLPICWKGAKPFKSITEIMGHFKPLVLSFTNSNAQLPLLPDTYLIISKHGNACLGILNGTDVNLGDMNVIGDIFLQDKVVIYDNEKRQIG